jgi:hypothetical protein
MYLESGCQSGGGYFDPEDYVSHQVFISLYTETDGYYAYLEPCIGHEAFTRYGEKRSKTFAGVSASAGFNHFRVGFRRIVKF